MKRYNINTDAKRERINIMMSNKNYINWLKEFTFRVGNFFDDDWIYFPELIDYSDRMNVENLELFYEGLEGYAKKNNLVPLKCQSGNYYNIKADEVGLSVGELTGEDTVYFSKHVDLKSVKDFIDFNDVICSYNQTKEQFINSKLQSLSNKVIETYEAGVPYDAIVDTLNNTLSLISSKEMILKK